MIKSARGQKSDKGFGIVDGYDYRLGRFNNMRLCLSVDLDPRFESELLR